MDTPLENPLEELVDERRRQAPSVLWKVVGTGAGIVGADRRPQAARSGPRRRPATGATSP